MPRGEDLASHCATTGSVIVWDQVISLYQNHQRTSLEVRLCSFVRHWTYQRDQSSADTSPVLDFCCHVQTLLYEENGGTCRFEPVLVCQGHNVSAAVFVHPHVQHWFDSVELSFSFSFSLSEAAYLAGWALAWICTVPGWTTQIQSENKQKQMCGGCALKDLMFFPSKHSVIERTMFTFLFIAPPATTSEG